EGDIDDAVAILDVEDDRVAADFSPMLDDAHAMIAARHDASQVNGADLEISCNRDRFLYNWRFQNSGDNDLLSGLEEDSLPVMVSFADGIGQFRRGEVFGALQILAGDQRKAVSALGDVDLGAAWRNDGNRRREFGLFGGDGFHRHQLDAVRILYSGGGQRKEGKPTRARVGLGGLSVEDLGK